MREKLKNKLRFERGPAKSALLLIATLTFHIFSHPLEAVSGEIKDAESVVEGLQKRYDSTVDFVADFLQETELKTMQRRVKAWGKVYFRRPGKMLWRYNEPQGQVFLADGEHLYYYQPEQKQVIKSRLSNAIRSDTPLSFLLGIGDLRRDFKATLVSTDQEYYVVRLTPKEAMGGIGDLLLGIEIEEFDILWAQIEDAIGNVTTIRFSSMQRGVGLKDSIFSLQIPDGVDIVELGS
ncbi:MAG: outer membrane lipoprotein carrier protein LolA [Candidatus Binatia bacterium]